MLIFIFFVICSDVFVNLFLFFYSIDLDRFAEFGSVFDGVTGGGSLLNMSTQAVMELIKNVSIPGDENAAAVVEIDAQELDQFNISRNRVVSHELDTFHGKIVT